MSDNKSKGRGNSPNTGKHRDQTGKANQKSGQIKQSRSVQGGGGGSNGGGGGSKKGKHPEP